jgi:Flp pilus assembly protein TadG
MWLPHVRARKRKATRRGAAAVELAVLLPVLIFCSMTSVDFARIAYVQVVLQNCARNGALYEFYKKANFALPSTWTSLSTAVNADAEGMTVTAVVTSPASATNNTVTVTVTTTYTLISMGASSHLPALPASVTLSQSATMPYPAGASPVN